MIPEPVQWLSDKVEWVNANDPEFTYKKVDFYKKFQFKNITAEIGDFILISNADAAEPDTVEGCDIARIVKLYHSHDKVLKDKYRAHVQWFSKTNDIPPSTYSNTNIQFEDNIEVVEDHRPFNKDVSIETFFKKCDVIKMPTTAVIKEIAKNYSSKNPTFLCRFQIIALSKRKFVLQPVLEDERKDFISNKNVLKTPQTKKKLNNINPKSANKLSIKKNNDEWIVKSSDVSKLTLMRDITNNYDSPSSKTGIKRENDHSTSDDEILKTPRKSKKIEIKTLNTPRTPRTPKRSSRYITNYAENVEATNSNSDDDFNLKTPPKKSKSTKKDVSMPNTPKRQNNTIKARKSLMKSEFNPTIYSRKVPVQIQEGALQTARESLHVSSVPLSLPCREEEFNNIYTFIESKIIDNVGGCMYISGVPGTGKTATVTEVLRCLNKQVKLNELPKFEFIEINGMRLTEPRQAYVQIYKQLTGKTVKWEQACNLLETRFTKPAPRRNTIVLLVDELDVLCNRRQDVLYNLLDWPSKAAAHLVVVAIANTMDLPERLLMGRVASRLGLTRLTFQPYTHAQLQSIVTARLTDTQAFNSDAIQLVARKVAAVSGDARRALDICRRAVELAEYDEKTTGVTCQVSILHVNKALTEMISNPKVQAIKSCSKMEQLFLQSTAAEIERSGIEETTFSMIYKQLETICAFIGSRVPTVTETLTICSRLGSSRLIICDHSRNDINQKVLLNISSDDVHYATQKLF